MSERTLMWGRNLALARVAAGYRTQRALAEALGVTQQAVSKWESGTAGPEDDMKVAISSLLKVDAYQLFPLAVTG